MASATAGPADWQLYMASPCIAERRLAAQPAAGSPIEQGVPLLAQPQTLSPQPNAEFVVGMMLLFGSRFLRDTATKEAFVQMMDFRAGSKAAPAMLVAMVTCPSIPACAMICDSKRTCNEESWLR